MNDLTPEQVLELARSAYPIVIRQLTRQGPLEKQTHVDFVHPADRGRTRNGVEASKE